jgi:hypothetical protein
MSLRKVLLSNRSVAAAIGCVLSLVFQPGVAAAVTPRIVSQVDDSRLVKLMGNVSPLTRAQNDLGEASSSTELSHIRLVLSRSPEQEAALEKYMAEEMDKSSVNYHKWLTPEEFGKLYGPADSDIAALVAWLESHGLKLEQVSTGRTNIAFSGTVGQVEETFHTPIHSFQAKGQQFYANTKNPSIPMALASVVAGVAQLNTFVPLPQSIRGRQGLYDPESKRLIPVPDAQAKGPGADLTTGSGTASDPYVLYLVPGDAATIYDTPNTTLNANYTSGTNYTGTGVTIGIGGAAAILGSTVVDYRTRFLGSAYATAPTITNVNGATTNGATDEAYLDNELAGGMAPGANLHFYTSTDLYSAIDRAISDNTVDIFSLSFGECELYLLTSDNLAMSNRWQQAAAQGIAVVVSTGDDGSANCDDPQDSSGNNVPDAVVGLQVSGFASTPYNVAVGGTDLASLPGAFSTYASGAGTSAVLYRTASKYIPEATWNDSTQADGKISANVPFTGTDGNITAGSGGKSSCSTNTDTPDPDPGFIDIGTCTHGYTKPTWQRGTGVPSDGVRDLPDLSLMAGNGADAAVWLVCTDDTFVSGGVTYSTNCATANGSFAFSAFGGTSASTPTFAGILALVQQKTGSRLGLAAKELYDLYNGTHASAIFHDTTVGNISVPCTSGTPNCTKNTAGNYYLTGYDTTAGYDLATGLGSVDAKQLITYWGSAIGTATSTVGLVVSPTTVSNLLAFTVAATVTGGSGTPTGTVTLTSGSYTSGAQTLSASGTYTFSVEAGALPGGTDALTVTYSGDATYASSTGTGSIIVQTPGISVTSNSLTFASTLVGSAAPTQTVTITNTGTGDLIISAVSVTETDTVTGSTGSFTFSGSCVKTLTPGSTCPLMVKFMPLAAGALTANLTVTSNAPAPNATETITLTGTATTPAPVVSLTPTSLTFAATTLGTPAPTQSITVKNTGTAILNISGISITGTGASSYSQGNTCGSTLAVNATCSVTVTFTPAAYQSLTAAVSIADNAANSPQTVSLTGTGTEVGTYSLSAAAVTVAPGSSGTSAITATGADLYLGPHTVTLNSCVLATSPTGAVDKPTCTLTSAAVTFASGAATGSGGTVTIATTAASASVRKAQLDGSPKTPFGSKSWAGLGGVAVAGLLLFGIPARRRKWKALLGAFIFMMALGVLSGCGGGSSSTPPPPNPGTTAGTYTFTVTGTDDAGVTATATVTVTVS